MAQAYQARYVQEGRNVDHTPGADVAAGAVVVQNSLVGIARLGIQANKLGALGVSGVYDVVKATGAINAGAALYWDADGNPQGGTPGSGAATTTPSDNVFMGFALTAAGGTDETVRMVLVPVTNVTNTIHNDLTNAIADPGNAGAIPITDSGHCSLVTSGAETRTLADPTNVGQILQLSAKTIIGACSVTAAHPVNQNGDDVMELATVGDTVLLVGIEIGADKRWRILGNDGVSLSTS